MTMMWGYGFSWFGALFMLAVWTLVVVGIVWLVRSSSNRADGPGLSNARRLLDERFASGDLSQEEYEERRRVLG